MLINSGFRNRLFLLFILVVVVSFMMISGQLVAYGERLMGDYTIQASSNFMGSVPVRYREYVTPGDDEIQRLAGQVKNAEGAYDLVAGCIYVTDSTLNKSPEKWLTPHEFLVSTLVYRGNPVPGKSVSDCEEHANTLVSLLRAEGVSARDVRVVLGRDLRKNQNKGHVWVQLLINNKWLDLDPSSGPYWDDDSSILVDRPPLPFDYYKDRVFPRLSVVAYYNDVYYYEPGSLSSGVPGSWK